MYRLSLPFHTLALYKDIHSFLMCCLIFRTVPSTERIKCILFLSGIAHIISFSKVNPIPFLSFPLAIRDGRYEHWKTNDGFLVIIAKIWSFFYLQFFKSFFFFFIGMLCTEKLVLLNRLMSGLDCFPSSVCTKKTKKQ